MYQEEAGVEPRFKGKIQGEKEKISRARHREILTIDLKIITIDFTIDLKIKYSFGHKRIATTQRNIQRSKF